MTGKLATALRARALKQEDKRQHGYTYTVLVHRTDQFPTDMLRRDDASPATKDDAELIRKLTMDLFAEDRDATVLALPKKVRVTLRSHSRFAPNIARWNSFGAEVVESDNPYSMISRKTPPKIANLPDPLSALQELEAAVSDHFSSAEDDAAPVMDERLSAAIRGARAAIDKVKIVQEFERG